MLLITLFLLAQKQEVGVGGKQREALHLLCPEGASEMELSGRRYFGRRKGSLLKATQTPARSCNKCLCEPGAKPLCGRKRPCLANQDSRRIISPFGRAGSKWPQTRSGGAGNSSRAQAPGQAKRNRRRKCHQKRFLGETPLLLSATGW